MSPPRLSYRKLRVKLVKKKPKPHGLQAHSCSVVVVTHMLSTIKRSRTNGWNSPPHWLQLTAWAFSVLITGLAIAVVVPNFANYYLRIFLFVVTVVLLLSTVLLNIIVTTIDPADDSVKAKVRHEPRPNFDRSKHVHVIDENYFCHICEAFVSSTSKHCRQCNKCVADFDHHCKWLNNCIGDKNYRWFIAFIAVTVLTSLWLFALSLTNAVLFATQRTLLLDDIQILAAHVTDSTWLALAIATGVMCFLIFALTFHLLIFHIRLMAQGTTTYNFILEERRKDEEKQASNGKAASASATGANYNGEHHHQESTMQPLPQNEAKFRIHCPIVNRCRVTRIVADKSSPTNQQLSGVGSSGITLHDGLQKPNNDLACVWATPSSSHNNLSTPVEALPALRDSMPPTIYPNQKRHSVSLIPTISTTRDYDGVQDAGGYGCKEEDRQQDSGISSATEQRKTSDASCSSTMRNQRSATLESNLSRSRLPTPLQLLGQAYSVGSDQKNVKTTSSMASIETEPQSHYRQKLPLIRQTKLMQLNPDSTEMEYYRLLRISGITYPICNDVAKHLSSSSRSLNGSICSTGSRTSKQAADSVCLIGGQFSVVEFLQLPSSEHNLRADDRRQFPRESFTESMLKFAKPVELRADSFTTIARNAVNEKCHDDAFGSKYNTRPLVIDTALNDKQKKRVHFGRKNSQGVMLSWKRSHKMSVG